MSKVYTAREMREMADKEKFKCSFVTRTLNGGIILDCTSDVRAMLRQSAEVLEREIAPKNEEIKKLRSLVGELADALDAVVPDNADCEDTKALCKGGCMPNGICRQDTIRSLVAKARKEDKDGK